jgi:uncharacterized protein YdcH (DUF465 family)
MAAHLRRLAGLLVRIGRLTQAQADEALARSHTVSTLIAELDARGWMSEMECARALGDAFQVPFVDLTDVTVGAEAQRAVPAELARKHSVVPLEVVNGRLTVAFVDPSDITVVDEIAVASGFTVVPVIAVLSQIRRTIERIYEEDKDSMADLAQLRVQNDAAFRELADRHHHLDSQLDQLSAKHYLSESEESEEAALKKRKLALAAQMERITLAHAEVQNQAAELRVENVDFSVFAPPSVMRGSTFILELWAYLRKERSAMLQVASRAGRDVELFSRGPVRIPVETELTVVLVLETLTVKRKRSTMCWTGSFTNVQFPVSVPADAAPGDHMGEILLLLGGMRLTSLLFQVTVGVEQPRAALAVTQQPVRTAFASYATPDRDEVLSRVQGITATGVDVFLDVLSLRAGDNWEEGLLRNIRERDVFYLFWSRAASTSDWVEKEWRYALKERGADYIHPIPLADPREVPPPPELATKHFNDVILACLESMRIG